MTILLPESILFGFLLFCNPNHKFCYYKTIFILPKLLKSDTLHKKTAGFAILPVGKIRMAGRYTADSS